MSKDDCIEVMGEVIDDLPGLEFSVKIKSGKDEAVIRAYLSGKMRRFKIKLVKGDKVKVELSPYDLTRGRIVYREK